MKKLLGLLMFLGLAYTAQGQNISKNALGLRLGDNKGFGTEVSYQRGLGSSNRLELDLGWRNNDNLSTYQLVGLYQWVWNIEGGFNWYAGVGGGLGSWSYNDKYYKGQYYDYNDESRTFVFAAGDIGVEYDFDIPLLISLDFRPQVGLVNYGNNSNFDIALGVRYQF